MTLAKSFDTWAQQHEQKGVERGIQQGIQQGIEKGIEKGKARLLQRLLVRRFGTLSSDVVAKIAAASSRQLELWADRVLDAPSLDDIFRA
jgi:flagellar biosynthesis/type III secretory pathway protein FliH